MTASVTRPRIVLACLLASLLVSACGAFSSSFGSSAPPSAWVSTLEALQLAPDRDVESIPAFRIDRFRVLDSSRVLIHSGTDRSHMVTLRENCSGLGAAQRLGYTTSAGALTRSDKLIVFGTEGDVPCPVEAILLLKVLPLTH